MRVCSTDRIDPPVCQGRKGGVDFTGGDISSNGGAGFLQIAEQWTTGLSGRWPAAWRTDASKDKVRRDLFAMLSQRVFAIAQGHGGREWP